MARFIEPDYRQQFLLPPALEDWVSADHPARFLREFVDQLDLKKMGFVVPDGVEGRPPYAPSLLLKIWLYGYFHRIRSTRKLEAACREQMSLIWLTAMITPDHNSLWRFWNMNRKALRNVFKQTVQIAVNNDCVGFVVQALDGTKIEAAASGYSGWSKDYMTKVLRALDAALDETEKKVEEENSDDDDDPGYRLPEELSEREALREKIKKGLEQLTEEGREYYHPVEPEARRMKVGSTNRFAYNAQAVVDQKEGIIVACENTRAENDMGQLVPMLEQAKENAGARQADVTILADTGYSGGPDLQNAQEKGFDVLAPTVDGNKDNPYALQYFIYDPAAQTVTCPRGLQLHHQGPAKKRGYIRERYRCTKQDCPVRTQCSTAVKGRTIDIYPFSLATQQMRKRFELTGIRERWRQRGQIVELCFAHLKQHNGFRRWTVWGLEGVKAQWAMLCAASNLRVLFKGWLNRVKTV